nr:MAG TPA: hypothetical protein [Caudoviricetes sp.]
MPVGVLLAANCRRLSCGMSAEELKPANRNG